LGRDIDAAVQAAIQAGAVMQDMTDQGGNAVRDAEDGVLAALLPGASIPGSIGAHGLGLPSARNLLRQNGLLARRVAAAETRAATLSREAEASSFQLDRLRRDFEALDELVREAPAPLPLLYARLRDRDNQIRELAAKHAAAERALAAAGAERARLEAERVAMAADLRRLLQVFQAAWGRGGRIVRMHKKLTVCCAWIGFDL
jgi:hypothetical protein